MNTNQTIKYINAHFNNIVNIKIKEFEHSVIKHYSFGKTYELKNPVLGKHFIINAIKDFNNKLTLEDKKFWVDFDECTYKYFIRLDRDYFEKQGCISHDEKIRLNQLYNDKFELNQIIKENTNDKKLKNDSNSHTQILQLSVYEITVRWYL